MEKLEYKPLGSIVIIKGSVKKFMIVARALTVKVAEENAFFDYGACMYPEGMIGDKMMYFQNSEIVKTVFEGYADDDNKLMVDNINNAIEESELVRADVKKLQEELRKTNG